MIAQCALLKCYTILGYSTETVLLIFPFLQTNITVQIRPSGGRGVGCPLYGLFTIIIERNDCMTYENKCNSGISLIKYTLLKHCHHLNHHSIQVA